MFRTTLIFINQFLKIEASKQVLKLPTKQLQCSSHPVSTGINISTPTDYRPPNWTHKKCSFSLRSWCSMDAGTCVPMPPGDGSCRNVRAHATRRWAWRPHAVRCRMCLMTISFKFDAIKDQIRLRLNSSYTYF
jgi:hypothetical protein